jgi:hypothetical protein
MSTFVMLTRISAASLHQPKSFETLERQAMEQVRKQCLSVHWIASCAVLGPYDYLDVFTAPNLEMATQVSIVLTGIRHDGQCPIKSYRVPSVLTEA